MEIFPYRSHYKSLIFFFLATGETPNFTFWVCLTYFPTCFAKQSWGSILCSYALNHTLLYHLFYFQWNRNILNFKGNSCYIEEALKLVIETTYSCLQCFTNQVRSTDIFF